MVSFSGSHFALVVHVYFKIDLISVLHYVGFGVMRFCITRCEQLFSPEVELSWQNFGMKCM